MKRTFITWLIIILASLQLGISKAQTVAKDTITFTTENVVAEPDPNKQNYIFTLYSMDEAWKVQLNYYAESMFGSFGNEDFRLSGEGKYYNFARNPKNDMVFYSFTDMQVTVADELTQYRITANCLTSSRTRFLMEGIVKVPQPTDTIASDLGYASATQNSYFGTYVFAAENDAFRLQYGMVGQELIGTFYTADLLKPELHDKLTGQDIEVISAQAVHTQAENDTIRMTLDLLSSDLKLYHLTMYNAPRQIEVTGEEDILAMGMEVRDVSEMYGCVQILGESLDYYVSLAIKAEAADRKSEDGVIHWSMSDFIMPYTFIMRKADGSTLDLEQISAVMSLDENRQTMVKAEGLCADGMLYHITMKGGALVIAPKDTVSVDFGSVAVLDYSKGLGIIGLGGVVPDRYQLRIYLDATRLDGTFTSDDCLMDMTDIMVVNGLTYQFHDAMDIKANFSPADDGAIRADIDLLAADTVLYRTTMIIPQLQCMQEGKRYDLGEFDMVALYEGNDNGWSEYNLQFQRGAEDFEENGNEAEAQFFSFYLGSEGPGLSGEYGYSEGNLAEDEYHLFYEQGAEVRVGPVAGTLTIEPFDVLNIDIPEEDFHYRANIYDTAFRFLGQNGVIYEGLGRQFLLCIDTEGELHEITETELASLRTTLAEHGYKVRKLLRGGRLIIEKEGKIIFQ